MKQQALDFDAPPQEAPTAHRKAQDESNAPEPTPTPPPPTSHQDGPETFAASIAYFFSRGH